ncbi:lipoprotein insertase outer membrane protein LolB [Nitrosovibrio tenuis]|uniref:Outer-membrane lipoprotein LolB n=1 Tax=Nitrosovibrio tenuis TaxID=1233 RepID=A0A1H7GJD7_9PROT|nr:lipoprotein insertase outer membrane protein LolB [Nitrosovibrio tenuis]SEK38219.1 outer membrane lipoprotein LolB [Nitrosovibrio tenuis]
MINRAGVAPVQFMRFVLPWWSLFLCAPPFFAGCALTPPTHKNNVVRTIFTEPVAGTVDTKSANFLLSGRVAAKGGRENFSGGVQWRHAESEDEILLLSPLGQALAQIQLNPGGAYLITSDQQNYSAADVEGLTEQVLGWHLPLMGLQYWVQGINSPITASEIDLDIEGRVVGIRQDGWSIDYSSYFPVSAVHIAQTQAARPRLLLLKRGDLQIKLIIDTWNSDGN